MSIVPFSPPQASHGAAVQAQPRDSDTEMPPLNFQSLRPLREREIRLLEFEDGEGDYLDEGEVNCRLTYHSLDEECVWYVALSYAWGYFDVSHTIKCDGRNFALSETLYSALIRLRKTGFRVGQKPRRRNVPLWIDAIYINQTDVVEKTSQVRMMKTIYSHAAVVVAWLGEEEESDQQSLEFMRKIVRAFELQDQIKVTVDDDTFERQPISDLSPALITDSDSSTIFADSRLPADLPDALSSAWGDFMHLLEKPWFSRVWIIQEYLAAEYCVFLCGKTVIEVGLIFESSNILLKNNTLCYQILFVRSTKKSFVNGSRLYAIKQKLEKKTHRSLLAILSETVTFDATDPRDKVFVVLVLSNDNNYDLIDYKDDLRKVLINTARRVLELEDGSLEMLSWAHAVDRTDNIGIPSWVPEWSSTKLIMTPLATIFPSSANDSEDRAEVYDSEIDENNALIVMSRIITHISKMPDKTIHLGLSLRLDSFRSLCYQLAEQQRGSPKFTALSHKLFRKILVVACYFMRLQRFVTSLPSYPTGQQISEVYWRSLVFDNEGTAPAQWGRDIERMCKAGDLFEKGVDPFDALPEISTVLEIDEVFYFRLGMRITAWSCRIGALVALAGVIKSIRARSLPSFHIVALFILAWTVLTIVSVIFSSLVSPCWLKSFPFQSPKYSREMLLETVKIDYDLPDRILRLAGRQICLTQNGYVAWVPETTRLGDQICHFRGSRLPFVIRSWEQNQELPVNQNVMLPEKAALELELKSYKLIGDCYLHGMMADKAMDTFDEEYH